MLTLTAAAALAAAAPVIDNHRFDRAQIEEAQRVMLASYTSARESASEFYQWASHNVTLDRGMVQQKTTELATQLNGLRETFTRMNGLLGPEQAGLINGRMTTIQDAFGKANGAVERLRRESGNSIPDRSEVRLLTSQVYSALALAHEAQRAAGKQLGLIQEEKGKARAR
jgi:hypothetical protein